MASFSKSKSNYSIRSISLPCRSHPTTARIEEELNKIKAREASSIPTAKRISNDLSGLMDFYKCMEDLLNLPITKQALSHHQCQSFVDDLQDGLMSLLDICGIARELMSQMKENGRDIQSSIRRKKGDSNIESIVAKYICFRKKMNKDAKKLTVALKQMENKIGTSPLIDLDHHVSSVIRVLGEVVVVSVSILQSLLLFVSVPVSKPKSTRWTMVSKLLQKGAGVASCENQLETKSNELQSIDIAINAILIYRSDSGEGDTHKKMQVAQNCLKCLEVSVGDIEDGLECLFRGLIRVKASLLNIPSSV